MFKQFVDAIQDEEGNLNFLGMKIFAPVLVVCILLIMALS